MKIGVDARVILKYPGLGRYCRNIIEALARIDGSNDYTVFTLAPFEIRNSRFKVVQVNHPVLSYKTFYAFSGLVNKYGFDVFFSTFQVAPLAVACPMTVVVHDMMDLMYPDAFTHHPFLIRMGLKSFFKFAIPRSIRKGDMLITVSESTRKDLLGYFKDVPPDKVVSILEGVEPCFAPVKQRAALDAVRRKYGISGRFILYLGSIKPYKNLNGVLEAFGRLRNRHGIKDVELVIAGLKHFAVDDFQKKADSLGLGSSVRRVGFVSEEDLPAFYSLADVFLFPSIWEGFGLPALEAMACGAPVITSNTSSLPEVVGDAGIKVNPLDYDEIALRLKEVLMDAALRERMRSSGITRAKEFSWEKAAGRTLEVLTRTSAEFRKCG